VSVASAHRGNCSGVNFLTARRRAALGQEVSAGVFYTSARGNRRTLPRQANRSTARGGRVTARQAPHISKNLILNKPQKSFFHGKNS
jgi:hypothetical protein